MQRNLSKTGELNMLKVIFTITLAALGNLFSEAFPAQNQLFVDSIDTTAVATEINQKKQEKDKPLEPVPVEQIRILVEVFHKLKKDYVEELNDEILVNKI